MEEAGAEGGGGLAGLSLDAISPLLLLGQSRGGSMLTCSLSQAPGKWMWFLEEASQRKSGEGRTQQCPRHRSTLGWPVMTGPSSRRGAPTAAPGAPALPSAADTGLG